MYGKRYFSVWAPLHLPKWKHPEKKTLQKRSQQMVAFGGEKMILATPQSKLPIALKS